MGDFACILDVLFLEELYLKSLFQRRAAKIRRETHNFAINYVTEEDNIEVKDLVEKHFSLPLKFLFLEPMILLIAIHTAGVYGVVYFFLAA